MKKDATTFPRFHFFGCPVRMMKNGVCLKIYQSIHLAKKDGFNDTLIIRCCKGRMKKHKGYNWEYI